MVLKEGAAENQAGEVLLVFQGVGLRENAAVGVAQKRDAAEGEFLAYSFNILHHGIHGVAGRVIQFLRFARSALVDEGELMVSRQRREIGQEIIVRSAGSAVDDDKGTALAEGLVVNEDAVGIHVAVFDSQGCAMRQRCCQQEEREESVDGFHDGSALILPKGNTGVEGLRGVEAVR